MKYFICGFMGAGKSTLLKELADLADFSKFELIDLDDYIYREHGEDFSNLGELIEHFGLDYFRALEFSALMNLSKRNHLIVALGGGSLTLQSRAVLTQWQGYWLNTPFDICWERIEGDCNRPLVKSGRENLQELYNSRLEDYSLYQEFQNTPEFRCLMKL